MTNREWKRLEKLSSQKTVKLKCKICGHLWKDHYESIVKGIYVCGKDNCTDWNRCGKPPKEYFKKVEYEKLLKKTTSEEEHPEWYEGACLCQTCYSYGD